MPSDDRKTTIVHKWCLVRFFKITLFPEAPPWLNWPDLQKKLGLGFPQEALYMWLPLHRTNWSEGGCSWNMGSPAPSWHLIPEEGTSPRRQQVLDKQDPYQGLFLVLVVQNVSTSLMTEWHLSLFAWWHSELPEASWVLSEVAPEQVLLSAPSTAGPCWTKAKHSDDGCCWAQGLQSYGEKPSGAGAVTKASLYSTLSVQHNLTSFIL